MVANTKVFVGSLPQGVKPVELRRLFESYGVVTECDVMNRCGFVHMETAEMSQNAIKALNSTLFKGQTIVVEKGRPKETKEGNKGTQKTAGGNNANANRRRRSRGNRPVRGGMGNANQMMNSNDYDDSALQLCSALFYEMNRMLSQGANINDGPNQEMMYQGNNIGGGGADRNRSRARSRRNRGKRPENVEVANQNNIKQQPMSAKPVAIAKKQQVVENKNIGKPPNNNETISKGNLKRNMQDNAGPMRKQQKVSATPYNRNIGNAQNNMRNVNLQNSGNPRRRGLGYVNNGNFGNDFDDNFSMNNMGQGGMNTNFGDRFDNTIVDNFIANKLQQVQAMGDRSGNFGNSGMSANSNNFGGNFGMGNQDRRGFALPERQSFIFSGQQMGGPQSPIGRSASVANLSGRMGDDSYINESSFGLSRGNNMGNSAVGNFDIERRSENLGMMSRGNALGIISNGNNDFERRNVNLDMLRGNNIGNGDIGNFEYERRSVSVARGINMGGNMDFERRSINLNLPKGNITGNNTNFERRNMNFDNLNPNSLGRILNSQTPQNRGGMSTNNNTFNNSSSFGGNFGNNRGNSSSFQNEFPPLGNLMAGGMNRIAARQNMMSDRRY